MDEMVAVTIPGLSRDLYGKVLDEAALMPGSVLVMVFSEHGEARLEVPADWVRPWHERKGKHGG